MKKNIFIIVYLFIIWISPICGQNLVTLQKENATLMKSIKKQYGLKKVEIRLEKDGFWYFLLMDKYKSLGVADKSGKVIIPIENSNISYFMAEKGGVNRQTFTGIGMTKRLDYQYNYQESGSVFLITYGSYYYHGFDAGKYVSETRKYKKFVSPDGRIIIKDLKDVIKIPGYWVVSPSKVSQNMYSALIFEYSGESVGLLKSDGQILLKPDECFSIRLGNLVYPSANDEDIAKYWECIFTKSENEVLFRGGLMLNQQAPTTPCCFSYVSLCFNSDKKEYYWRVQSRETDDSFIYEPERKYIVSSYKDEGERLYNAMKYDEVIAYYAKDGITAPWAKFFTGMSLLAKASRNCHDIEFCVGQIEEDNPIYSYEKLHVDLNLVQQQCEIVVNMLDTYIKEDSIYYEQAIRGKKNAKELFNEIPEIQLRYDKAINLLIQREKEQRLAESQRQREEKERAQQRQNVMMAKFLGIFLDALTNNTLHNNGNRVVSESNYITTNTDVSSGNNSNASKIADWQSRKSNSERRLADYKEKLEKEPNSSYLKQVISSEERIINECNDNIARLQSSN